MTNRQCPCTLSIVHGHTRENYIYESIEIEWNCSNPFTFNDFPDGFLNLKTYTYDATVGGSWFEYPSSNICNSSYSAVLIGGESYIYEFWVNPNLEATYESYLNNLVIKDVLYPHEDRLLLPRYTNNLSGYELIWDLEINALNYVEFGTSSVQHVVLERLQDLESSQIIEITARLKIDGLEYERTFQILLEAKGSLLQTPELKREINSITGFMTLVWDPIPNADYYEIAIKENDSYTLLATIDSSNINYKLPGAIEDIGNYDLVVRACSKYDTYYQPSSYSDPIFYMYSSEYERLDAPVLTIDNHILKWNDVSFSGGYYLYCDDSLVAIFPKNQTQYDIYNLNLSVGEHEFRIIAIPEDYNEFNDSPYSNKIKFEEVERGIGFIYNNDRFKYINYQSLPGATELKLKESLNAAIPTELNLSTGIAIVTKYYLDKDMTLEISKESIFEQWKSQNYRYMDLYLDVVQPLVYEGPTIIYKNPEGYLKTDEIKKIVDEYCKKGTKSNYSLTCISDKYTGFADKPGTYTLTYECIVDGYITNIDITVKVSSNVKADYIYNNKWFSRTIISQENIISTAKFIGTLPDVTLNGFEIVTLHNDYKTDYYGSKPSYGTYNFIINYESHSGAAGLVQFEVNYLKPSDMAGEELPSEFPIGTVITILLVATVGIGAVVFFTTYKKSKKYKYRRKGGF